MWICVSSRQASHSPGRFSAAIPRRNPDSNITASMIYLLTNQPFARLPTKENSVFWRQWSFPQEFGLPDSNRNLWSEALLCLPGFLFLLAWLIVFIYESALFMGLHKFSLLGSETCKHQFYRWMMNLKPFPNWLLRFELNKCSVILIENLNLRWLILSIDRLHITQS